MSIESTRCYNTCQMIHDTRVKSPVMTIGPTGQLLALGFRIGAVPGVPKTDTLVARTVNALALERPADGCRLDAPEWESVLNSLGNELHRSRYHRLRLDELISDMQQRRELVGGPVLGDRRAAPPAYYEATAFLSAVRTAVDLSRLS